MKTFIITKDGIARVGRDYPRLVRHKETGGTFFFAVLHKQGILPIELWTRPLDENEAAWRSSEYEPIYGGVQKVVESLHPNDQAQVTGARDIAETDIPPEIEFKDAWEDNGAAIVTNMPKARVIRRGHIRVASDKKLVEADNDLKTAEDDNDQAEAARIRTRRKALRDLPATFDLSGATTPAELKALWPPELADSKLR